MVSGSRAEETAQRFMDWLAAGEPLASKDDLELVRRAHRCVRASGVRCIPRARVRADRARLELDLDFRLRDQFVQEVALERLRAGPASATFRAA